jgi:hypothetical protein
MALGYCYRSTRSRSRVAKVDGRLRADCGIFTTCPSLCPRGIMSTSRRWVSEDWQRLTRARRVGEKEHFSTTDVIGDVERASNCDRPRSGDAGRGVSSPTWTCYFLKRPQVEIPARSQSILRSTQQRVTHHQSTRNSDLHAHVR